MKKIVFYLKQHLLEDYNPVFYGLNAAFLIICISFNYYVDLENSIIDAHAGKSIRIFYYFLLYGFAYYFSCITHAFVFKKKIFLNIEFWIKSLVFLLIISFDGAFHYHRPLIQTYFPFELQYFLIKVSNNLAGAVTILLPLFLFYVFYEKEKSSFYGFSSQNIDLKPYWILLLLMTPLVFTASFNEGFLYQYPNLKDNSAAAFLGWNYWVTFLIFEIAYAFDFLTVELMFRGFIVIGMIKVLGKGAIVPMIVTYAFYHFGKPPGEAISSIFGGYILGVIALHTRSILGGIIVHIGVAWMMEFFAFMQKTLNHNINP